MSPVVSVAQALLKAAATHTWAQGMCGQFCAAMYGYSASGYRDAVTQWQQTPGGLRHSGTNAAPAGALFYWGGGSAGHGHVAIADGTGACWSIDIRGAGTVARVPVTEISATWGLPYLGWAYPYFQGEEWEPAMIYGVDVSNYQDASFPLTTPGDLHRVDFAFVKATQGTGYTNPIMQAQTQYARTKGLVTGFYHFLEKGNIKAQAAYFTSKAPIRDGDVLACDWETDPATRTYASAAEKKAFIEEVQRLKPGHKVLLYCNTSFWKNIDTDSFAGDGLWIATGGYSAGKPPIQSAWVLHQYSTAGNIDHNVAQFASRADMATWAGGDDVALTTDDINKIAAAVFTKIFKTDDVLASPADAADHATNPFWTFQTHVQGQTTVGRATQTDVDAVLAQVRANGAALTEIKTTLAALDLSGLPQAVADKLAHLKIVLEEDV